jgi:endonuclease/exonuclease/phosphatase family metal-dependent hydrolase
MLHTMPRAVRRFSGLLGLMMLVAALAPAAASAGPEVKVMTRNIYLGTGLTNVITATDQASFIGAVTQDVQNVLATNFPVRAGALADEIKSNKPDLVGLQEVSLWRTQNPSDFFGPNAGDPFLDFLTILQANLAAKGLNYNVVSTSTNADVEAPFFNGTGYQDIRLTDRDVILAKAGTTTSNPQNGNYAVNLSLPTVVGSTVTFTRGWTSVDVRKDGKTFRFFNSHLETEDAPPVQVAQGSEALGIINASPYPTIVVGDYNSAADGSTTPTYANLTATLKDAWKQANGSNPGYSCCQNELLTNATSLNHERIDLVLTKGKWAAKSASLVGATPFRLSPPPLWAADHAGVVAKLELK